MSSSARRIMAPVAAFALLLIALAATADAYEIGYVSYPYIDHTREEVRDEHYLEGTLTWKEGKGGLAWTPEPESDGPAGPVKNRANDDAQWTNSLAKTFLNAPPAPVEFTSDPLPFDVWINASRLIQFDLFIAQPPDSERANAVPCMGSESSRNRATPAPEVRLLLNDALVTGASAAWPLNVGFTTKYFQPDPPGYNLCHYRMPTEVEVLPKGSQLKLQLIVHAESFRHYQYGTSDEERSVIRIPYFPQDEIIYRHPELNDWQSISEVGPEETESTSEAGPVSIRDTVSLLGAGGVGVAGLSFASRGFRRRSAVLAILLALVFVGFAGCAKAPTAGPAAMSETNTGGATSVLQPANGSNLAGGGLGAIVGLVHDDMNYPLRGAYVALIGTPNATESDARGRFQFRSIPPGAYALRIDHPEHRTVEAEVKVVRDSLTRIEVTMVPTVLGAGGTRSHDHDYWSGETSAVLLDEVLAKKECDAQGTNCKPQRTFDIPADPAKAWFVRPGTRFTDVTVSWPAEMGIKRVGLYANTNLDGNGTYFLPRASPATFRIVTTWEMADAGHQAASNWRFVLYANERDQPPVTDPAYAMDRADILIANPPWFTVKVSITKGALPLERPHPDHWGSAAELVADRRNTAGPSSQQILTANALVVGLLTSCAVQTWANYQWIPEAVIPPYTKEVQVTAKLSRRTGIESVGHWDFALAYKPAGVRAQQFVFPTFDVQVTANPLFKKAPAAQWSEPDKLLTWRFPVAPTEADPMYATASAWTFAAYPADMKQACIDTNTFAATNPNAASILAATWTVTAIKGDDVQAQA